MSTQMDLVRNCINDEVSAHAKGGVHRPGIEPGSVPWQGTILPLDHRCGRSHGIAVMSARRHCRHEYRSPGSNRGPHVCETCVITNYTTSTTYRQGPFVRSGTTFLYLTKAHGPKTPHLPPREAHGCFPLHLSFSYRVPRLFIWYFYDALWCVHGG